MYNLTQNQQWSATGKSEFLGFAQGVIYKINSLTAQQLNSSTIRQLNSSTAQQLNSSTTQQLNNSTAQQINNSDPQTESHYFWVWHKLSLTKSTNQQENALLMLSDLKQTLDKINKSTAICNLLVWIFGF